MINPINVEKTSDLTNVHSNFIFNKFNTSVSILPLLPFSCYTVSDSKTSWAGFPVLHCLPEFAQTHVHWVNDAIQPSHRLSSSSAFSLSQHQGLFQGVSFLHQVAKLLEFQLLYQSFQLILRTIPLGLTGWISLQFKGLLRVFSSTTVQKHQFFGAQLSFGPTLTSIHNS